MKRTYAALISLLLATACSVAYPPVTPNPAPTDPPIVVVDPPVVVPPVDPPAPEPVDWCATKTEDQLRDIRADLGGVRLSFDTSATRGNYLFTPTYPTFDADTRAKIRREYKDRGYTHFPIGPVWERGYPGWAGHDFRQRPAEWVALLEELWRDDLIPMVWLLPDGPYNVDDGPGNRDNPVSLSKVELGLTPLYSRADMQRVTCVTVLGWEVTDNEWVKTIRKAVDVLAWQARVFPRAFRYWHAAVDNGAGCNYEADGKDCEGKFWRTVAPFIHGQFWQTGTTGGWNLHVRHDDECDSGMLPLESWPCWPSLDPNNPQHRIDQFLENLHYEVNRFHGNSYVNGGVRGADGKVLDVIYGEGSAYFELNDRETEAWGREWGRLALTVPGVRGFGDGGPGRPLSPYAAAIVTPPVIRR